MVLNFYNNNTILAPLKCGTRYLKECFGEESGIISISELNKHLYHKNVEAIIIRSPYEHLESALHTELLKIFNNSGDTDEIESMLDTFNNRFNYPEGSTHWSPALYEKLYWYWRRNRRYVQIIELKDLSTYLTTIKTDIPKYNPENYNFNYFKYWCSKDDIIFYVKENYKSVWDNLMVQIEKSNEWYNLLITNTIIPLKMI